MSNSKLTRLIALGKLWANIDLFHPFLAYKNINWDSALASAIPKVEAAQSDSDYLNAVNFMLSHLNDDSTYAVETSLCTQAPSPTNERTIENLVTYTDDGIVIFDLKNYSTAQILKLKEPFFEQIAAIHKRNKRPKDSQTSKSAKQKKATAIVFDLRRDSDYHWAVLDELFGEQFADYFCTADTVGAALRTRMHLGQAPETVREPGKYHSAFFTTDGERFLAGIKPFKIPIVFLINWLTNVPPLVLSLQAQANVNILKEGSPNGIAPKMFSFDLPGEIIASIRLGESVTPDGSTSIEADKTIVIKDQGKGEKAITDKSITDVAITAKPVTAKPMNDKALKATIKWARKRSTKKQENKHTSKDSEKKAIAKESTRGRLPSSWRYCLDEYPSKEYRQLAVFRIWSVIAHFFPYLDLIDGDWDKVLTKALPEVEQAKTAEEYHLAVAKMISHLQDSHAAVTSPTLSNCFGEATLPIRCRIIEDKFVVTEIIENSLQDEESAPKESSINIGDIIVSIDGVDIRKKFQRLSQYFSASTQASLANMVTEIILDGDESIATLEIETNQKAKNKLIRLQRTRRYDNATEATSKEENAEEEEEEEEKEKKEKEENEVKKDKEVKKKEQEKITLEQSTRFIHIPNSQDKKATIGYVDLTKLNFDMVDDMFTKFKHINAIIFDMRGYPNLTGGAISSRLAQQSSLKLAKSSIPLILEPIETCEENKSVGSSSRPSSNNRQTGKHYQTSLDLIHRSDEWIYKGKTVLLIDERAISQAESLGMALKAANGTVFIGTPTAGANGVVTDFSVPGNIRIIMSGEKYEFPDGSQLQRKGLQPDILVKPTIEGIRSGRDEVLETAISFVSCP